MWSSWARGAGFGRCSIRHTGYFVRKAATRVSIIVAYERPEGERRVTEVAHDLEIFRELAYLA